MKKVGISLKKKIIYSAALILMLLFILFYYIFKDAPYENGMLSVHFIDVGQASAALVIAPSGETMLIDTGSNFSSDTLITYLMKLGITSLDILVITHFDEDHTGGADELIGYIDRLGLVVTPPISDDKEDTQRLFKAAEEIGADICHPSVNDVITLSGEVKSLVLFVSRIGIDNEPIDSIVLKTTYKSTDILFTADISNREELIILENSRHLLDCEIMGVPHHGSLYSSSESFVYEVSPRYAAVSCGLLNKFGHPAGRVLDTFESAGTEVYRTDINGSIVFTSDGKNISVSCENKSNTDKE